MSRIERESGRYIKKLTGEEDYSCFVPNPLPPIPPIKVWEFYDLLDKANVSVGELNAIRTNLPDTSLFITMFSKREAVLSSQIEGTQSTLSELLMFEKSLGQKNMTDDNIEVSNYVSALEYGLKKINELPLSRRLICEIHKILLSGGRGEKKMPGEFRVSQNWIGGLRPGNAKFVPPPPENIAECFGKFEKFLNDNTVPLPILVKVAIAHVQFEFIHPFLDGNGRLGRLLIIFMLCVSGFLKDPILYLSLFFKINRDRYYSLLNEVRMTGNWEEWIKFFLTGVYETSKQASHTAQSVVKLFEKDEKKIKDEKRSTVGVLNTFSYMKKNPISDTKHIMKSTKCSAQTILRSLKTLEELAIVRELTGRYKNKTFIYENYIELLSKED